MWGQLTKLRLLLWKNFLIEIRKPITLFIELLLPLFIPTILIIVRSTISVTEHKEVTTFNPFPVAFELPYSPDFDLPFDLFDESSSNPFSNVSFKLAYVPSNNKTAKKLAEEVTRRLWFLLDPEPVGYADEDDLEEALSYNKTGIQSDTLCAIVFTNIDAKGQVAYKLRFPYSLRVGGEDHNWATNGLYPSIMPNGPKNPYPGDNEYFNLTEVIPEKIIKQFNLPEEINLQSTGGLPCYYLEGFLSVQAALDLSIMETVYKIPDLQGTVMKSHRFSYPPYTEDNFVTIIEGILGTVIILCFVFTTFNIVKNIVSEKEKRLKESMKIMGLENYLHWTAWFIQYTVITLIVVSFTTLFLCTAFTDYRVLPYSDWTVIYVFLFIYGMSSMTFCFFLSTFFSKANTAAVIATILWFISFLPWNIIQTRYTVISEGGKLFSCILCNTGMALASYLIGEFEASGVGAQWDNISQPVNTDDNVALLDVFIFLIADSFIYGFLTWYVEAVFPGDFGYPQKFYFFLQPSYWFSSVASDVVVNTHGDEDEEKIKSFIQTDERREKGIEIKGLRKEFKGNKVAVHNLNLDIYTNERTVLLGHNGAGKTTTMSIITGLFPATCGTATINGYQLNGQLSKIRESLGLCPQHDVLFDDLTVKEHLIFFGSLKGASRELIDSEIPKLLGDDGLCLMDKLNRRSKTLSGGMKRKLSVAIALIGNSKIVILDEPTSGMDPQARRNTWDVLMNNTSGRTVLLTTHFMDEADALGSRIAIMAQGKLQCVGSPIFLKSKYGVGYQMNIVKTVDEDMGKIIEKMAKNHVSGVKLEREIGKELVLSLPSASLSSFPALFDELENRQAELNIETFGVSETTIEEVFLKVGKLQDDGDVPQLGRARSAGQSVRQLSFNDLHENGSIDHGLMSFNDIKASYTLKDNADIGAKNVGFDLYWQQFQAMFWKRVLHSKRNKKLAIAQILIPAWCVIIALLVTKISPSFDGSPELKMKLNDYEKTYTYYSQNANQKNIKYAAAYEKYVKSVMDSDSTVSHTTNVNDKVIERAEESIGVYNTHLMVGVDFDDTITIWFNNQAFHTAALSLNLITNAMLTANNPNASIQITNAPLPPTFEDSKEAVDTGEAIWQGFYLAFNIAFGFAFLVASFAAFPVKERSNGAKHLQYVSGLQPLIFWTSAFLWDTINFLAACFVLIILFAIFQVDAFTGDRLLWISLIFCEYSIAALPLMYCCSFMFKDSTSAFVRCTTINILLAVGTMITVTILKVPGIDKNGLSNALGWVFITLVPQYCLPNSLVDLYINYVSHDNCDKYGLSYETCAKDLDDGFISKSYISWKRPGVGSYLVFYVLHSVVWWTVLICIESNVVSRIQNKISQFRISVVKQNYIHLNNEDEENSIENPRANQLDDDVQDEVSKVVQLMNRRGSEFTGPINSKFTDKALVVNGLSKTYYQGEGACTCCGDVVLLNAVKPMHLTVPLAECFGLLGVNGAGKTTTFKMLTGDYSMTSGTAYIDGIDISENIKKAQQFMGYCPQFDALIDQMTGRETLRMYAKLRGIRNEVIEACVNELLKVLDLDIHADKLSKDYSGGNKRKLSTGVALIGTPPLVFLDEPTTGMDPGARRSLWKVISQLVQSGKISVVLTSHSMEECEFLCGRLAIMVNGIFRCLGSPQHLKNKFGQGFTLIAKLDSQNLDQNKGRFHDFVNKQFPGSIAKDDHLDMVHYQVQTEGVKWSQVFQEMETNKDRLRVKEYSVCQTSLEQIFLNFAKTQNQ